MPERFGPFSKLFGRLARRRDPTLPISSNAVDELSRIPSDEASPEANLTENLPAAEPSVSEHFAAGHHLLRLIGRGAYGEVWLGRDELGNYHAVKLVRREQFADKAPFEREYRGLLQYTPISRTHHGLVPILNVGRDNAAGLFFYVMELADCVQRGREFVADEYSPHTLEQALSSRGHLSLGECLTLGIELCEALGYLHSKQLIHRDIKPPNIVFVNGMAKLADVGLITHMAEASRDPKHLGTEGFIPPEGPGTPLADVYSLGKVLSEAAFGTTILPPIESCPDPETARFVEIMEHACHESADLRSATPSALQAELMDLHDTFSSRSSAP